MSGYDVVRRGATIDISPGTTYPDAASAFRAAQTLAGWGTEPLVLTPPPRPLDVARTATPATDSTERLWKAFPEGNRRLGLHTRECRADRSCEASRYGCGCWCHKEPADASAPGGDR